MEDPVCTFRPGIPGLIPDAWVVSPREASAQPPIVAVHGVTRKVEEMAERLLPRARAAGRSLVVPHFSPRDWPRYQRASCTRRADWALLRLMTALRAEGRVGPGPFDLSGFSGGAQFAHRFTWLYPGTVGRLCVASPGWWTFPDIRAPWPRGIGIGGASGRDAAQSFRLTSNLRAFLDRRIIVRVGSDDVLQDGNLRRDAGIDAQQGINRVQRARRWADAAESAALAQGLTPRVSFRNLKGCGHSFGDCVARGGLDADFIAPAGRCQSCRRAQGCPSSCHDLATPHLMERTAA